MERHMHAGEVGKHATSSIFQAFSFIYRLGLAESRENDF